MAEGLNVAQLMVTVGANTAMAEQGIMGIARMIGPGGILALGAVGGALAVAGIGVAAIKMAGDFQTQLTQIVTGAGEAQSNLGMISTGVLQMARDTGTSTKQLTDGLYMIESGGYHGAAALKILQAAAEGAKVGNADLGVVADATDTVLKNFGDTGLTATQAVNTLITTVANGKTHMQDLAAALAHILPTAAATGVSLKDVMGAMATMTGEGVDAANAATYLRQMMIALAAPTKASEQALARIGLTTAQVSAGMKISLPSTLAMITDAIGKKFPDGAAAAQAELRKVQAGTETFDQAVQHLSGNGMSGYMAAIRDISGGSRQMQGMLLLSGQHMATFNADVKKIGGAAATTGDQIQGWDLVQGTFNQSMARLGEIFQTVMITLGTQLLPVATQFANLLATDLGPAVDALTGKNKLLTTGMGGDLMNAAKSLGGFFEQTVVPIIKTFATVLEKNVLPAILPVVKTIIEKWLPPLERIMKDILPVLNPLLQALGWLFQNVIGPGLNLAAQAVGGMLNGIADLIDGITKFVHNPSVNNMVGIMKDIANAGSAAVNLMTGGALSKFLPHFAEGGVMQNTGLALVGEAGPELVNLPGGAQVTPMSGLGGFGGGGGLAPLPFSSGGGSSQQPIYINQTITLDGQVLTRQLVRYLPDVIRQATGARHM
jgi:TP901 family phage tail tape measure protein